MTAAGPRGARRDRQEDGLDQRLHAAAGERPVRQLRDVARLPVRRLPDLRLHVRDVGQGLPRRFADRLRDRAQQGSRALPDGAGVRVRWRSSGAAVRTARCGAFDDDLEVYRGWHVNPDGTDTAPASARFTPRATRPRRRAGTEAARDRRRRARKALRHRRPGRDASASANDLDGRTTIRSPAIALPAAAGQRLTFRYVFAHSTGIDRRPTACERSSSAPMAARSRSSRSSVGRSTSTARGGRRRSRWMPSPGRRSASASSPPTAAPATCSRSSSTTSG